VTVVNARACHRPTTPDRSTGVRGLVSCTGIDYCHFVDRDEKELALRTAQSPRAAIARRRSAHDALVGCPAGMWEPRGGRIGCSAKNARVNGEIVDAVDVFVGGRSGPMPVGHEGFSKSVPCDESRRCSKNDSVSIGEASICGTPPSRRPNRRGCSRSCHRLMASAVRALEARMSANCRTSSALWRRTVLRARCSRGAPSRTGPRIDRRAVGRGAFSRRVSDRVGVMALDARSRAPRTARRDAHRLRAANRVPRAEAAAR